MDSLKKLLKIAEEFGIVAVVSEAGELLGVLTGAKALGGSESGAFSLKARKQALDVEEINRQITSAQLEESSVLEVAGRSRKVDGHKPTFFGTKHQPKNSQFQSGARRTVKMPNLVQEVIDPSFDFDADEDGDLVI